MVHIKKIFILIHITFFISACITVTDFDSTWHDSQYTAGPIKKTLILILSEDNIKRRVAEDIFKNLLEEKGVKATSSYTILPIDLKIPKETVKKTIIKHGFDSVLVAKLLGIRVPGNHGSTLYEDYEGYYNSPQGSYMTGKVQYDIAYVDTKLYKVATEKLIWQVRTRTQTIKAENVKSVVKQIAEKLIGDLSHKNFL